MSEIEKDELLRWGNLRNALVHTPPERVRPCMLEEADIDEYATLAKTYLTRWFAEEETVTGVKREGNTE